VYVYAFNRTHQFSRFGEERGESSSMQEIDSRSARLYNLFFYIIVLLSLLFIFISQPFMKIPFDIWEHLMRIASIYDTGTCFLFWPEDTGTSMNFWHWIWAQVFIVLNIPDIFVWAKIIHVTQFLIATLTVYHFSKTAFQFLYVEHTELAIKFLALSSTLLWFLGNGTISIYQQAWINWYSVTYQGISIPLLWYILALTIRLLYEGSLDITKKSFYLIQITLALLLILLIHPTEFVYYVINLFVLFAAHIRRCLGYIRRNLASLAMLILCLIIFFTQIIQNEWLPLPVLFHGLKLTVLLQNIQEIGQWVTQGGGNRFPYALSEATIFAMICAVLYRIRLFFSRNGTDIKLYDFFLVSSALFLFIPLNGTLAGIAGITTHKEIVWRFFFGSAWFLFLPFIIDRVVIRLMKKETIHYSFILNIVLIIAFIFLSRTFFYQSFYLNANSIIQLTNPYKVGLQYSKNDLEQLTTIIRQNDILADGRINMFYIRGDMAPILRTVLRKYVYADRRYLWPKATFFEKGLNKKYRLIDIDLPDDFPKNDEIFRYFNLEKKP
jgi:hypothetical protein